VIELNFEEYTGISPFLGVLLLVGIVGIIAVTLGLLVFNLGGSLSEVESSVSVQIEKNQATLVESDRRVRVLVRDENGKVVGRLNKIGESIVVEEGYLIVGVTQTGKEVVLEKVEESDLRKTNNKGKETLF
jgi:hypothetical protein